MGRPNAKEKDMELTKFRVLNEYNEEYDEDKVTYDIFSGDKYYATLQVYVYNAPMRILRIFALEKYPKLENKSFIIVKQGTPLWKKMTYSKENLY